MQLKGLVRFFAIALILICLYQLSFTWIVRSHESSLEDKANRWLKASGYIAADKKYPGDKALRDAYQDTLDALKKQRLQRLEDSTKDAHIGPFGLTTYQDAKDKELMLGLDLQGGMSVTMEVGLDVLIHSLANNTKDPIFVKALNNAVKRKATGGADLIALFGDEYKKLSGGSTLAAYFVARSGGKLKYTDSDNTVLAYLTDQSNAAFDNTYKILQNRIDRFGISSATINKDKAKSIISIELPGINDPERVRRNLQATANLQFFEVYRIPDIADAFQKAEKALSDYLNGVKTPVADTTGGKTIDTSATTKTVTKGKKVDDTSAKKSTANAVDTGKTKNDFPIQRILQINPGTRDKTTGNPIYTSFIGAVRITDTALLNEYLNLGVFKNKFPANLVFMYGPQENSTGAKNVILLYAIKTLENGNAKLDGSHVSSARQDYDDKGTPAIKMEMDPVGTALWADMTSKNVGKPIAIVLDNTVYSAPNVINEIPNGSSEISGSFTVQQAQDLANTLESGKLPAPARIVSEQTIGPTLGSNTIHAGLYSFLIAFIVIFALMLVYYNTAGWVANIALILNLLFTIGILSALGFTLTAPGIAGLVLTIGMAVDTNVIIFERIKEELSKGKGYLTAVNDGYKRSYSPILDAHVTTFLTAAILFIFGLGPVLGFATTQMLGIALSLFCGILVSRLITDIYTSKQRHFEYFTGVSRKIFKHSAFKFIEYRKVAYGISVIVLALGIGSMVHGFDQGVEFKGGRSYTIDFKRRVNTDSIINEMKPVLHNYPIVKTVNTNNQLNITTDFLINETGNNVDDSVEKTLYAGLQKNAFIPQTVSFKEFDNNYKQDSKTVEPSISSELKSGAVKAGIFAIVIICLYIFVRFRDWRYSLGTIVSLLHDVLVILAVFSFFRGIVPFPLEIDQYFIAAVLTVIGFSMNDTVIVYDRIREDVREMPGATKEAIINRAINQTLSRTVMTSLTVFLTILILFIFGGEVTRGFAFAMLVGVITGTYSSIFVAAPILVDFGRNRPLGKQRSTTAKKGAFAEVKK
jgi:SecD/SecF fusion protein